MVSSETEVSAKSAPPAWIVAAQNRKMSALDHFPRSACGMSVLIHFFLSSVNTISSLFLLDRHSGGTKSGSEEDDVDDDVAGADDDEAAEVSHEPDTDG
jgi:hypothetical protein